MIATILEPLEDTVAEEDLRRVEAALCLVAGGEAMQVLRDVCRLDFDEAFAVSRWAADAILTAGLQQQYESADNRSSRAKARHPA